jgi:hypothetical protein
MAATPTPRMIPVLLSIGCEAAFAASSLSCQTGGRHVSSAALKRPPFGHPGTSELPSGHWHILVVGL